MLQFTLIVTQHLAGNNTWWSFALQIVAFRVYRNTLKYIGSEAKLLLVKHDEKITCHTTFGTIQVLIMSLKFAIDKLYGLNYLHVV